MPVLLGILAGMGLPVQTGLNTGLRKKVGSPFLAALLSFLTSFAFLLLTLLLRGGDLQYPFAALRREPLWIWAGGLCGVTFLTGNILLFAKLDSVQAVIFPVAGQILMGLLIDHFGLFHSAVRPLTFFRLLGAACAVSGVWLIARVRSGAAAPQAGPRPRRVWPFRLAGILTGMLSAVQTAVNGYLGVLLDAPLKAALVSFTVGILFLCLICLVTRPARRRQRPPLPGRSPWYIWFGGIPGAIYALTNLFLSHRIGTGMTVLAVLIGSTGGSLLIDRFGLFCAPKRAVTWKTALGVFLMLAGAGLVRLL